MRERVRQRLKKSAGMREGTGREKKEEEQEDEEEWGDFETRKQKKR